MSLEKPHRIRVKVLDGKPRDANKLKGWLVPHGDVIDVAGGIEFVIRAVKEKHLEAIRPKFDACGLKEIVGGDTDVPSPASKSVGTRGDQRGQTSPPAGVPPGASSSEAARLKKKPYGFVPLPKELTVAPPVWHDGTGTEGRLSGEIRCELTTLTPLLVGWERRQIDDTEEAEPWGVSHDASVPGDEVEVRFPGRDKVLRTHKAKAVLCPLRMPGGDRPVLLPGDSIKGWLRHELGALLGAPMERVAERSYSYRPNSLFPKDPNPRLIPRLARIRDDGVKMQPLCQGSETLVRVPVKLDLLDENLKYAKRHTGEVPENHYAFDAEGDAVYRGGQGAGEPLNAKGRLHTRLTVKPPKPPTEEPKPPTKKEESVPEAVQAGYRNTLRHLLDLSDGHFSGRHPDVPKIVKGEDAKKRILEAASNVVFQPGDLIWIEWDTQEKCVVSLGWHYYYRWAYEDTVRCPGWKHERKGLFPLEEEKARDDQGAPQGLSPVRRLFGYIGDNDGSKEIGQDDYTQLLGRISVNAAIEVIEPGDTEEMRFLGPTFLKELGMPRPSAVEHYLEQPHYPQLRPSDCAKLVTYGDAVGYDKPGKLAGRKFYLDRPDAYSGKPWEDESPANRLQNERSTLALEASHPGRKFRFTLRFRDLDPAELASVLVALAPHQFRRLLAGNHPEGYCSKLGYARPLGWGSVRIQAEALLLLDISDDKPVLTAVPDVSAWVDLHHHGTPALKDWLAVHRHKHPDAGDYPRKEGHIFTYHATLRAEHSRERRYTQGGC